MSKSKIELTFESPINKGEIEDAIRNKKSFVVKGPPMNVFNMTTMLDEMITAAGMFCSIYTKGRTPAAIAATLATGGAAAVIGGATLMGVGAHNLATRKVDFEIGRNVLTGNVTVKYVK